MWKIFTAETLERVFTLWARGVLAWACGESVSSCAFSSDFDDPTAASRLKFHHLTVATTSQGEPGFQFAVLDHDDTDLPFHARTSEAQKFRRRTSRHLWRSATVEVIEEVPRSRAVHLPDGRFVPQRNGTHRIWDCTTA